MSLRRAALALATAASLISGFSHSALAADPAPKLNAAQDDHKPIIKRFETWSTRCDENQKTKELIACHAFIDVRAGEEKKQVLYLGVGRLPKSPDEYFAFAMTPLGTVLPQGVGLSVDEKDNFGGPFTFCIPMGCQAEVKLTAEQLKAMKSGKEMTVIFRLMGQGVVKIPVKLTGFTAAVNSLPTPKKPAAN